MRPSAIGPLFYFGTLISSVGSFTFNVALIAFMIKSGFHLGQATLVIGLQRLVPVLVTGIWGHWTDRISPRKVVVVAEVIAALTSILLLFLWAGSDTNYPLLAFVCVIRAVVVSFQIGSRAKIAKLLSDDTYAGNSKHAIWFHKATQGATLFGGLIAWVIIRDFDLETAVILDATTFIINGIIVFIIPNLEKAEDILPEEQVSWREKFRELFQFNRRAETLDILLAVSMMGTLAFTARLAGAEQSWTALYMGAFGLAVWVSGFLERGLTSRFAIYPFWIILGISFALLGSLGGPSDVMLLTVFVKDIAYWIILHRISSHIQMDTPRNRMGSVFSARTSIMVAILALGEVLVGAWSNIFALSLEGAARGLICVGVGLLLLVTRTKKESLDGRPAL